MEPNELKELLDEFLNRWQLEDVKKLTLQEYVGVGNKDTFCQWVETKTKMLGSINGMPSIKFGIYERIKPEKKPKNYENGSKYSWLRGYGTNEKGVFKNVKADIIKTIELSEKGLFNEINEIILPSLFKWKVAFLYSNERLIPIFKRKVLFKIAQHFGLNINRQTQISEIQELMISHKPANQNVYQYMRELYDKFSTGKEKEIITGKLSPRKRKGHGTRKRTGTTQKNTQTVIRTIIRSYMVEQKHNKIQEALRKQLAEKYGEINVILEENYVDVKLIQPNYLSFYEVKSSSYASECVKEALGQILLYTHNDQDNRKKKIFVVGQYPTNEQDKGYIEFVKKNLNLEFDYINVDIT